MPVCKPVREVASFLAYVIRHAICISVCVFLFKRIIFFPTTSVYVFFIYFCFKPFVEAAPFSHNIVASIHSLTIFLLLVLTK